ncbi:hypothetical protein LSAT2_019254, partial [Lamellibrachia satsuma]
RWTPGMLGLHENMVEALYKFCELDSHLLPLLEATEVSEAPAGRRTDKDTEEIDTYITKAEDTDETDAYITKAEDTIFETSRYMEAHPASPPPAAPPAVAMSA